jgi:hypothetical protein
VWRNFQVAVFVRNHNRCFVDLEHQRDLRGMKSNTVGAVVSRADGDFETRGTAEVVLAMVEEKEFLDDLFAVAS